MIGELVIHEVPSLWSIVAALPVVALLISNFADPELVEVYLGDSQFLAILVTLAIAAVAFL